MTSQHGDHGDHCRQPHAEGRETCGCGQELDVCHHEHCPRCGHRLRRRELVAAG